MTHLPALTIADIPWLRLASRKSGAVDVPHGIAAKLLKGGFVRFDGERDCLTITRLGELALTRLA
jgi:hypothetical protein